MAQFETTKLTGSRVLVKGEDNYGGVGSTVLDSSEWEHINKHGEFDAASEAFDQAVEAFFEPLTQAADALLEAKVQADAPDPATVVVVREPEDGKAPVDGLTIVLSHDSVILRLIEQGDTDRLIWVNDQLEVTAAQPAQPAPTAPGGGTYIVDRGE